MPNSSGICYLSVMKQIIKDQIFGGERPLFALKDAYLENIEITDGESGIKCCSDLECHHSRFYGKYPWWHVEHSVLKDCYFAPGSRSAIWYSDDMSMSDCLIDGPKFFREMKGLSLDNVKITDADETFWRVEDLSARNLELHEGTYPFMWCKRVKVDGLKSDSKYVFQYCSDVEVHNAQIVTKDAFWECDNVTIYDSDLSGEYLGWHSRNLHLVRCHISGEQPLCYVKGLLMEDCTFDPACDRIFEDSEVDADILGHITQIKNPLSGRIIAGSIGEILYDRFAKSPRENCIIKLR